MKTNTIAKSGNLLWGVYHGDRQSARQLGDPLRTVVEAPTQIAAEEAAARLGFSEPRAQPVNADEVQRAEWLPNRRPGHRQELARQRSRGVHL